MTEIRHDQILGFISRFRDDKGHGEVMVEQFSQGYCYHFALVLSSLFEGGEVCWVGPYSHFVWMFDGIPYDINGVYQGDSQIFIPSYFLGDSLNDFKRIPDQSVNTSKEQIEKIISDYEAIKEFD